MLYNMVQKKFIAWFCASEKISYKHNALTGQKKMKKS